MAARRPSNTRTPDSAPQSTAPKRPRRRRSGTTPDAQVTTPAAEETSYDAPVAGVVATVPDGMTFADLGLSAQLVKALADAGVTTPFPIQAATLPDSLAGRDVLGRGRTGSGKTYAFALPVLAQLAANPAPRRPNRPRALVLAPTRELATQIQATFAPLATALKLKTMTIFGGVGHGPQITGLRNGVDIVIACPGRLEDHVREGHAKLDAVEITVLDEADHMADLGFLPVVRRLLEQTPADGQRLLFSATLDAGVDVLVKRFMNKPVTHSVDSARSPVAKMTHHVLHVHADTRLPVLVDLTAAPGRTLVFTRTKYGAKSLTKKLISSGVPAVELHGNLSQGARTRNLEAFSEGSATTLVATDIAARGIHVDDVSLVIHADPPIEHKAYLHRSGRTARAGAEGTVVTLMTDDQVRDVRDLTRKAGISPTITRLRAGDPLLAELAPGERTFVEPAAKPSTQPPSKAVRRGAGSGQDGEERTGRAPSGGRRRLGTNRGTAPTRGTAHKGGSGSGRSASTPKSYSTTTPGGAGRTSGAAAFSSASRSGSRRTR
jgi:superfamily II DNA/RNA helicase